MGNTMKAIVVRAPMQFEMEDVPMPECPEGGFVLKIIACGLCGSDLRTLRSGHSKVNFPWVIGHEIAGTVVERGSNYDGQWQIGDVLAVGPVNYCGVCDFCVSGRYELCENHREIGQAWHGGFAEYIAIAKDVAERGSILRVPDGLDPAIAAISEPISSCVNAQDNGQIGLGDTVVVIGAGPIGCIHTSMARARGADRVIIADVVADRLKMCEAFGPDDIIDASKVDLVGEVRRLTDGKGAEVIITANPVPVTQVQAVEMAKKAGRILLFGGLPKDNCKPGLDTNIVHYNALRLIGTTTFAPRHQIAALKLLASGRIPGDKLITHRFPLSEFNKGAAMAMEGKVLKSVILP
ncbi:alcohol dehydrogenase catalytic domain-containing protein [Candidatus Poribacteria bacterium]